MALEIKGLYTLLDQRNHELTYLTMRMENDFAALFKLVYGCQPQKGNFKFIIDQICNEQEQVKKTLSQTFFPIRNSYSASNYVAETHNELTMRK